MGVPTTPWRLWRTSSWSDRARETVAREGGLSKLPALAAPSPSSMERRDSMVAEASTAAPEGPI